MFALDHLVDFDERRIEALCERRAERRFAGAAQADQRDAPPAVRGPQACRRAPRRRHKVYRIDIERARDRVEHQHARVPVPDSICAR